MTTANAIFICESLADKYGSATVSTTDWTNYLNMASLEVLNKLFPDTLGGQINVETDSNTLEEVRALVFPVTIIPSSGLISNTALATALQTASGDSGCSSFRLLNMSLTSDGSVIRFVKFNNVNTFNGNVFKAFTSTAPGYTMVYNGYKLTPSIGLSVNVTCIKTPKILTNTGESLEFGDDVINQIIFTTLKLAGVQIRDEQIAFDVRNTGIETAQ